MKLINHQRERRKAPFQKYPSQSPSPRRKRVRSQISISKENNRSSNRVLKNFQKRTKLSRLHKKNPRQRKNQQKTNRTKKAPNQKVQDQRLLPGNQNRSLKNRKKP